MPITPRFSLSQDADFVTARVTVPHVRVSASEIYVDGPRLSISVPPYLLQLVLPGDLCEDDCAAATYDADDGGGTLTVRVAKAVPGALFADLDLAGRVLAPRAAFPLRAAAGGAGAQTTDTEEGSLRALTAAFLAGRGGSGSVSPSSRGADVRVDGFLAGASSRGSGGAAAIATQAAAEARADASAARSKNRGSKPLIEVISSVDFADADVDADAGADSDLLSAKSAAESSVTNSVDTAASRDAAVLALQRRFLFHRLRTTTPASPIATHASRNIFLRLRSAHAKLEALGAERESGAAVARVAAGVQAPPDAALRVESSTTIAVEDVDPILTSSGFGYGFNRRHSRVFAGALREELCVGLLQIPDPEGTAPSSRPALRLASELAAFDADRYAGDECDGADDAVFIEAASFLPWWVDAVAKGGAALSADDADELARLPRLELLVDDIIVGGAGAPAAAVASSRTFAAGPETTRVIGGLVSILFAYAYDARTTGGEPGVESPWTIATLSPLLSWLDDDLGIAAGADDGLARIVSASLSSSVRRALVFPYMRRWDIAVLCASDAATILLGGRRAVLCALLGVRRIFASVDSEAVAHFYLLNSLFIDEYLVWAQGAAEGCLFSAAQSAGAAVARLAAPDAKRQDEFACLGLQDIDAEVALARD
jgi:hypothetical protein